LLELILSSIKNFDSTSFRCFLSFSVPLFAKVINSAEQPAYISVMISSMNDLLVKKMLGGGL
jgi:hypothetical protein